MDVKVYTTKTCPWCRRAKDFLIENNIPFEEVSVQDNQEHAKELIKLSGQMGVPVIVAGDKAIVGFDEEEIKKTLGID
jgi:glutaredoxin 3